MQRGVGLSNLLFIDRNKETAVALHLQSNRWFKKLPQDLDNRRFRC